MISMYKKYRVEPGGGSARILAVDGKIPGSPIIVEYQDERGAWGLVCCSESGKLLNDRYCLVEVSPYDHIKEGDWCVFWDAALGPPRCSMSFGAFAGLTSDGYPILHGELAHHGFHHCMPIAEFLEKYGNKETSND